MADMETKTQKVLGTARYEARWVQRSFMVRLTARGILPCLNYSAQLEKRPERVVPPMWDLVFFIENFCVTAVKPFEVEAHILNAEGAKVIKVRDAAGEHEVPILDAQSAEPNDFVTAADRDRYLVYARLPRESEGFHGCVAVPEDTLVPAVYYSVFGPASKADCEDFLAKNCRNAEPVSSGDRLRGGEIPWPLVVDA